MPRGIPVDPKIRNEVVDQVRNNGMSVRVASEKYGFTSRHIYSWLREGVVDGNRNLILENNRLKKELETAYRIIGRLTAETSRPKR